MNTRFECGLRLNDGLRSWLDVRASHRLTVGTVAVCLERSRSSCRHIASADSPTPAFSTSSRAMALIRSSSASSDCSPSPENLPSIISATSIFLPISRRQTSCIVPL